MQATSLQTYFEASIHTRKEVLQKEGTLSEKKHFFDDINREDYMAQEGDD